jgi:hypothetical protein
VELLNDLLRSGGFEALSRQAGCSPAIVTDVAGVLIPGLFDAMRHFVRTHGGGDAGVNVLMNLIIDLGDGDLAAEVLSHDKASPDVGNVLLARLYPDRTGREDAIGRFAFESGQDRQLVGRMAPYAAMLLAGYLGARITGSGASGSGGLKALGSLLDALKASEGPPQGPG